MLIVALAFFSVLLSPSLFGQEIDGEKEKKEGVESKQAGVQWVQDFEEACNTAKAEDKLVFIEFTAEW
jgi:thiol:disulfide interchange protein